RARQSRKSAELAQAKPVMRITRNQCWISVPTKRKNNDRASALGNRFGNCQRQCAATANEREWAILARGGGCTHLSSSASLRFMAIVKGRFPARINSIILPTSGSEPYS